MEGRKKKKTNNILIRKNNKEFYLFFLSSFYQHRNMMRFYNFGRSFFLSIINFIIHTRSKYFF